MPVTLATTDFRFSKTLERAREIALVQEKDTYDGASISGSA